MKRQFICSVICAVPVLLLTSAGQATYAAKVLEFNFAQTNANVDVTDGQTTNPVGADYNAANIKDDTGTFGPGQNFGSPWGKYVTGASVPNVPATLPPGWDGKAVYFPGTGSANIIRFDDTAGAFAGSFSAYARFNRQGLANDTQFLDWIIGGGQPNNFGWGIYLSHALANPTADSVPTLDVNLGGDFKVAMSQRGAFDGTGPQIANNTWYDVGITYSGTPFDGIDDTLKVFFDGELIRTFTGDADFDPRPFGFSFSLGGDSFANEGFKGHLERVLMWDEAITDADMLALMPSGSTPLQGDVNFDGLVNIFDINLVSSNWGTAGPTGDANGDMIVNIFDINLISSNWSPGPGAGTAVPEPATLAMALTALCGLVAFRRRVAGAKSRER